MAPHGTPGATLYTDILLDIMDVSSRSTVAALMRTCRTLYHEGPRRILKDGPFVGDSPGDTDAFLRSFCLFLLAERGGRFPYLRQIYLGLTWIENKDVAETFYQCVKRMVHLEVLVFVIDLDALLGFHPGLADAFAEIRTIKYLQVSSMGKKCYDMLKNMRSRLTGAELKLWQDDEDEDELPAIPDMNPVTLLAHSRETLERLQCESWDRHRFPAGSPQYPAMRRLTLTCEELPSTAVLVQAYPELSHLALHWSDFDLPSDTTELLNTLGRTRTANLNAQAGVRAWKQLDEVDAPLAALFALGLSCPVKKLLPSSVSSEAELIMLALVLERTRPEYLRLHTLGEFFDERPFDIPDTLSKDGASRLRTLDISIDFKPDVSPNAPIEEYMAFLLHGVRQLRLEKLSVAVAGWQFIEREQEDPSYIRPNGSAGLYLHNMNFRALAGGFLDVMPTLRSVTLKLTDVWNPDGNIVKITRADTNAERKVVIKNEF